MLLRNVFQEELRRAVQAVIVEVDLTAAGCVAVYPGEAALFASLDATPLLTRG